MTTQAAQQIKLKLKETLFHPDKESQVIHALFQGTEAYEEIYSQEEKVPGLVWVSGPDPLLIQSIQSFLNSTERSASEETAEEDSAQANPEAYTEAGEDKHQDFLRAACAAILLRNDYLLGERYQLPGQGKAEPEPYPEDLDGLIDRWEFISGELQSGPDFIHTIESRAKSLEDILSSSQA